MKHTVNALVSRVVKYKVGGSNGFECGILILNDHLSSISSDIKKEICVISQVPEIAFLFKNSGNSYYCEFFKPSQEIAFCGHATMAAAVYLNKNYNHEKVIDFITKNGIKHVNVDNNNQYNLICPISLKSTLMKDFKNYANADMSDLFYDKDQDKYFIIYNDQYLVKSFDIEKENQFHGKGVLICAETKKNVFYTSFFRNCKEDSLHVSGIVPLMDFLNKNDNEKVRFIFPTGNEVLAKKILDKVYLSSPVNLIQSQLYMGT